MPKLNQKGIASSMFVMVLLLVLVIGYAAYTVFDTETDPTRDTSNLGDSSNEVRQTTPAVSDEPIDSAEEVESELAEIEAIDLDTEFDTSDLEAELNGL